ncbi:hypothetical protein CKA32_001567 [Geitlerinema sp. FC II]|nr:hypothetical protein CKA32_001567 [Geitlerinema sp. FC II]
MFQSPVTSHQRRQLTGNGESGIGNGEQLTGNREQGTGNSRSFLPLSPSPPLPLSLSPPLPLFPLPSSLFPEEAPPLTINPYSAFPPRYR